MAAVDSDRNLLFGIIALQNGFIEQPDLIAAFQCWSKERSRPMSEILFDRRALTDDDREMVEELVRHHVVKYAGRIDREASAGVDWLVPGDREVSGTDALDAENNPARERLGSGNVGRREIGNLTVGAGNLSGADDAPDWDFRLGASTSQGGRFRLLRQHAKGGIGVVFVALDAELHREVALKQIQPKHADDPASRARFLVEAEVTGRLEHPGIVPVYGLGQNDEGRPYYAMRFVRGQSLKEAIEVFHHADQVSGRDPAERMLSLRRLLGRFIDVCHAIAYAHSRGVLHRDLKPANILLGPYGETLVVDWGLAKVVGRDDPTSQPSPEMTLRPATPSGSSETMAGTAIGTPMFMSPEQADGRWDQIGMASDIYCLGATLYCLLAGKPAIEDRDVEKILARVRRGEFSPPRQVNRRVPRALEAIVKKAMALNPADRYESAHELAREVERWLADEPVHAWREPVRERLRRWLARRRTAVAALAATVLVSTLGLGAVLLVQTRANASLKSANLDLAAANQRASAFNRELVRANARERARFELSLDAIKTFHRGVSEDLLLKEKEFAALRTKLLHGATGFYQRLESLLQGEADHHSREALGQAYHDIGELTARIGTQTEALAAFNRGLELRLALAEEPAANDTTKLQAAQSFIAVGNIQEATGKSNDALASYDHAHAILEPLARLEENSVHYGAAVAECLQGIARVQYSTGHAELALASHERARAIRQSLADANPGVTEFQTGLVGSHHDIGAIERASGHKNLALAAYEQARAISQKLAMANPGETQFQSALAQSHNDIGYLHQESGDLEAALVSLKQARTILQKLCDANPAVTQFEGELAQNHQVIGSILDQTGHPVEALESYERARAILARLVDRYPTFSLFQNRLAMSHSYIGLVRRRAGRLAEAATEFGRAVSIMERLSSVQPDGFNLYNLACFQALLSGIAAEPGAALPRDDAGSLAAQAVGSLRRATDAGFRNFGFMRRDSDLDALRGRADFQLLLMDVAFPENPFAK